MKKIVSLLLVLCLVLCVSSTLAEGKYTVNNGVVTKTVDCITAATVDLESGAELRTVKVRGLMLRTGTFVLTDEDAFLWIFKLGEFDLRVGDEYTLILGDVPSIREIPEAEYVPLW